MCGISAIFAREGCLGTEILGLNAPIQHRGPDDEGYFLQGPAGSASAFGDNTDETSIAELNLQDISKLSHRKFTCMLGHRRLSIVDTSWRGHQPMMSPCGSYAMVYNGEVYNSEEIKAELLGLGYTFTTSTDTEVVLASFQEWGSTCLSKFNGMFSLIIINKATHDVFVARDRFGIKPLYYNRLNKGCIAFASEIKQFTKMTGWTATLNQLRAIDYLNWGQTDHTEETMFDGVLQVPAGHYCNFNYSNVDRDLTFVRWYSVPGTPKTVNYEDAVEAFRGIFKSSVDYRLKADVPVGTCLSGGLDSSSIVCTINDQGQYTGKQVAFSSCSSDSRFDESGYVDSVIARCGRVESHRIEVTPHDFWRELPQLIYHHDEPFLSPSVYAEWSIYKEVKKRNVKVTLDGHGADEILMGYYTFFGPYLSSLLRKGRFIEYCRAAIGIKSLHGYGVLRILAMSLRSFLPNTLKQHLLKKLNRPSILPDWINSPSLGKPISDIEMSDMHVRDVSLEQLLRFSVPKQLKWCDRDSMAHSIESRVPFLDFRLVDFLFSLPEDFKLRRGLTKRILRDSMAGIIPEDVERRINKMGFVTPGEIWVQEDPQAYKAKLREAIENSGDLLNSEKCYERFSKMIDGRAAFDNSFWRIIFFGEWMKCHNVKIQ